MASTFIGMGTTKKTQNIDTLKKENAKLVKANEKAEKEKADLQEQLVKANEKIAEMEAKTIEQK